MKIVALFTAVFIASMFAGTALADDGVDHSKPGPDLSTERPDSTASTPAWFIPDHCYKDRIVVHADGTPGTYICPSLTVYRAPSVAPPAHPGLNATQEEMANAWAQAVWLQAGYVRPPMVATTYR